MANVTEIISALEDRFEKGTEIKVQKITKAGDKEYTGIIIKPKETNITPNIYLWDGYEDEPLDKVVDKIIKAYEQYKVNGTINIDFITDWEKVKGKILIQLVNPKTNEKYLENLVTYPFLDLTAIFYITVFVDKNSGIGNVKVRNDFLEKWGVTAEEIFNTAVENTREEVMIEDMAEMFKAMGLPVPEMDDAAPMIILSNKSKVNGAGVLPSAVEMIRERYGKCYILPSSIHEMIILPDDGNQNTEEINDMICAVNETQLAPEEVLSNHAYYIDETEIRVA